MNLGSILLLFGVPFLGALAGGYLVNLKSRRMRVNARGAGSVYTVAIDVDSADAEKAIGQLRSMVEDTIAKIEKLNCVAKDGAKV
jgi:hypothetical protein